MKVSDLLGKLSNWKRKYGDLNIEGDSMGSEIDVGLWKTVEDEYTIRIGEKVVEANP